MDKSEQTINLSNTVEHLLSRHPAVMLGTDPRFAPFEAYKYYSQLFDYLQEHTGVPIQMVETKTYGEMNELLKKGDVEGTFTCSGPYVAAHKDFGVQALVVPVFKDNVTHRAYLIVPVNSSAENFSDLRGTKFAFMDPISNTGYVYPLYRLKLMNETPDSFFGDNNYFFTYSHDNSVFAVAEGLADGAFVDGIVFEYMKREHWDITSKVKVIEVSEDFGAPPFVISNSTDVLLALRLKRVLLNMHRDEEGRRILDNMGIERFAQARDSDYDGVRAMWRIVGGTS
jgi:phosphonate transport system substrate-binding protein